MSEFYSAKGEKLEGHLGRVFDEWNKLKDRLLPSLVRLIGDETQAQEAMELALAFHDLGKLTRRWQERADKIWNIKKTRCEKGTAEGNLLEEVEESDEGEIEKGEKRKHFGIPHAFLGGCYLALIAKKLDNRDDIFASAFAVAIHHLDSGLVAPSLEQPDVLAIRHKIVDDNTDALEWAFKSQQELPTRMRNSKVNGQDVLEIFNPLDMSVYDLAKASEALRKWALSGNILEQHKRRILASAIHSIIKVCDIRAAVNRGGERNEFTELILKGGLIV